MSGETRSTTLRFRALAAQLPWWNPTQSCLSRDCPSCPVSRSGRWRLNPMFDITHNPNTQSQPLCYYARHTPLICLEQPMVQNSAMMRACSRSRTGALDHTRGSLTSRPTIPSNSLVTIRFPQRQTAPRVGGNDDEANAKHALFRPRRPWPSFIAASSRQ